MLDISSCVICRCRKGKNTLVNFKHFLIYENVWMCIQYSQVIVIWELVICMWIISSSYVLNFHLPALENSFIH